MRRILVAIGIAGSLSCGGRDGPSRPTPAVESLELRIQTDHFRVFAGSTPEASVRAAADRLEAEYPRILRDLNLAALPVITVRIWHDETTYFAELTRYFGVRYGATGYITGPAELRLLDGPRLLVNVVHEFIHAASLSVNARIANNPRWFWETVGGRAAFVRLIETNADLQGVLGLAAAGFEAAWQSYVRQRYLS